MSKIIKRILSFVLVFSLIFFVVFLGFNKAKETKAVVFPAVALGVGALGSLVTAYFATAGIQFSGSASADGDFLGNYVANWVKNSGSFANNPYFNSSGEFIGSSDDLSIVQNNDSDVVSFIFGKEFTIWLESLKTLFVSSNNLDINSSSLLYSSRSLIIGNNNYRVLPIDGDYLISEIPTSIFSSLNVGRNYFQYSTNGYLFLDVPSSGYSYTFGIGYYNNDRFVEDNSSIVSVSAFNSQPYVNIQFVYNQLTHSVSGGLYTPVRFNNNSLTLKVSLPLINFNDSNLKSISLDGTLTDGYSDFEDAINQDLDSDNEDLVVGLGVGEFADILNPSDILDGLLDKIIGGTLTPTYEGSFDNMEEAEQELEGSKPFVPVLPNGWVQVEGLQSFFPFCIPFDLYNVIALLNVPPEAPQFTWRMGFGSQFEPYDVEIDLRPYESVARVFRIMVVVGFLLFLILKTRDLIRG